MYMSRGVCVSTHYISRLNKRASVRLANVETTKERQRGIKRNRERGRKRSRKLPRALAGISTMVPTSLH